MINGWYSFWNSFVQQYKIYENRKVSVYLEEGSGNVLVVEDTGIGILPEDIPRVFEWGYTGYNGRLDKRFTRNWPGFVPERCQHARAYNYD